MNLDMWFRDDIAALLTGIMITVILITSLRQSASPNKGPQVANLPAGALRLRLGWGPVAAGQRSLGDMAYLIDRAQGVSRA